MHFYLADLFRIMRALYSCSWAVFLSSPGDLILPTYVSSSTSRLWQQVPTSIGGRKQGTSYQPAYKSKRTGRVIVVVKPCQATDNCNPLISCIGPIERPIVKKKKKRKYYYGPSIPLFPFPSHVAPSPSSASRNAKVFF